MRHTAVLAGALALVLTVVSGALAAPDPFKGNRDSVEGAGTFGPGCFPAEPCPFQPGYMWSFQVTAHSDPLGGDAGGYFRRTNDVSGNSQGGHVDCLRVADNLAVVGGIDELDPRPTVRGTFYVQYFVDGDPSGTPDLVSPIAHVAPGTFGTPSDFPASCPEPVSPFGYLWLTSGDVMIGDAVCDRVKVTPNEKVKCKIHPVVG
jgi:hypothetical protein